MEGDGSWSVMTSASYPGALAIIFLDGHYDRTSSVGYNIGVIQCESDSSFA